MAIEGPRVEMELKVPASDIVGFEHAPSNAKQREAIADAKKRLAKLADLLVLPNEAGCKLTSAKVDVLGAAAGSGKVGHKHGHSHSHGHSHAKKADGKAQAKADAHDDHSEFKAAYALECAAPGKLGANDENTAMTSPSRSGSTHDRRPSTRASSFSLVADIEAVL